MNFNEEYQKIKLIVQDELEIIERKLAECINVREPLNTHLKKFLILPSKRIRIVLPILYLKCYNEEISEKQFDFLTAIELVHNASLIHDDIIDESKIRRGQETTYSKFGNKLGVIAGDYLLSIAMEKIVKLNSLKILENFTKTLQKMCLGEINQNFDRFKIGTIEEYIEKSKNKTAYLFETAFLGSTLLSENSHNIELISNLGLNIGTAFQIRDDLINITKQDDLKPSNNDIGSGIYNSAVIYSGQTQDLTVGIEKTKRLLNNYVSKSEDMMKIIPDNEYKNKITDFLELLEYVQ